jgi:adenylate cyclase
MSRLLKAIPLGLIVGITGLLISFFYFSQELDEDLGLGLLFKIRGARQAPSDVVVVSIDRDSSEHLNVPDNPDKWPRSLHARLVKTLAKEGAKVVTFDVHFLEPRVHADDMMFAESVKKAKNVVLAEPLVAKEIAPSGGGVTQVAAHSIVKIVKPFSPLAQSAIATAPFVLPRIPFKVNQYWTFQTGAGDSPTFPVVALQLYTSKVYDDFIKLLGKVSPNQAAKLPRDSEEALETKSITRLIRNIRDIFEADPLIEGKMLQELDRYYPPSVDGKRHVFLKSLIHLYGGPNRRYLNYYGPPRTITTVPYYKALQAGDNSGGSTAIDFKGKAVFVGLSEKLLAERKDSFYTVFSQANGVFISGVEIAATAFSNMLENAAVKPIRTTYYIVLILAWGLIIGVICRISSIAVGALAVVGLSALYFGAANYQFATDGTWYPIVVPLFIQAPLGYFSAVLWNYVETNKERQQIRRALAHYVPDEVVDQLARNIVDIKNSGQMVYGACLFADVAGYTTLSEKMSPHELSNLMHKYFEVTFAPVKKYGGLVVNLKGDSFLAIWKASRAEAGLRRRACLAALEVAKAVHRFNESLDNVEMPTRVGVHSGQIFLGNIGAGDHYEYGPTGDTVNTASRMDGLNKYLGTEVLASEEIVHEIDGVVRREVGKFVLKGKAQPIVVHELLSHVEEANDEERQACAIFSEGMEAFRKRAWDEASEIFHRVMEDSVSTGPARFYIKMCEQYKTNPPDESWEGAIPVEEK